MAIDGFFIKKLIEEQKENIENHRIEKIYQVSEDMFVFSLYYQRVRKYLYFKLNAPNASFFISDTIDNTNLIQSNLLDTLKKNVEGSIITSIQQYNTDRVIIFNIQSQDFLMGKVYKQIILELMGRHNNLILVEDDIIIDAYHKKFSADSRSILPKNTFTFFPNDKENFTNIYPFLEDELTLSKTFIGISPLLSRYLFNNNNKDLSLINIKPTINLDTNDFYWFNTYNTSNIKHFDSLSKLLESVVKVPKINNSRYVNFVNKELIKYEKKLSFLNKDLLEATKKLNYKEIGDAIYSSGLNLNNFLNEITDYNNVTHPIDVTKTLNDNAQKYYKLYQKAKRSIDHINEQIENTTSLINIFNQFSFDLQDDLANLNEIENELKDFGFKIKKINNNKKKTKEIEILTLKYNDAIFYVGKNSYQNDYLTNKLAKHNDYWFHIKDAPGSHVVLRGELNDTNLSFAAMLAAKYSKESLNPVISVNYTLIKHVKKIPGLPGSFVKLMNYQTINIKIDEQLLTNVYQANKLQ